MSYKLALDLDNDAATGAVFLQHNLPLCSIYLDILRQGLRFFKQGEMKKLIVRLVSAWLPWARRTKRANSARSASVRIKTGTWGAGHPTASTRPHNVNALPTQSTSHAALPPDRR